MSEGESGGRNGSAIAAVRRSEPWLVGVKPAGEVVPGLEPNLILHAAPPVGWDKAVCRPTRRSRRRSDSRLRSLRAGRGAAGGRARDPSRRAARSRGHGRRRRQRSPRPPVVAAAEDSNRQPCFPFPDGRFRQDAHPRDVRRRRLRPAALDLGTSLRPRSTRPPEAVGGRRCMIMAEEALRRGDEPTTGTLAATSMLAERSPRASLGPVSPRMSRSVCSSLARQLAVLRRGSLAASRLAPSTQATA